MRISDWSSDVCSSDLLGGEDIAPARRRCNKPRMMVRQIVDLAPSEQGQHTLASGADDRPADQAGGAAGENIVIHARHSTGLSERSEDIQLEERRVRKEWVSTCRSRWLQYS